MASFSGVLLVEEHNDGGIDAVSIQLEDTDNLRGCSDGILDGDVDVVLCADVATDTEGRWSAVPGF